jgi:hypothetical protein
MPTVQVPTEIPENLHSLASRLSWEDATHLLCLYEFWMHESRYEPEHRARAQVLAEKMQVLVRALPYDWSPPPVEEHDIVTWLACTPCHVLAEGDTPPGLAYPVAAKVLSADIAHKTEAGGVVLNIPDAAALKAASAEILKNAKKANPDADLNGILVQRMQTGLAEILVGFRLDTVAGPVVVLGAGGVLTEIYNAAAVRVAPVDIDTAREMIAEVRGLAPIRGYRGHEEGDLEALAAAPSSRFRRWRLRPAPASSRPRSTR